jgi:hypothetical protein
LKLRILQIGILLVGKSKKTAGESKNSYELKPSMHWKHITKELINQEHLQ